LRAPIGQQGDKFSIRSAKEKSLVNETLKNDPAHRGVHVPKESCLRKRQFESRHVAVLTANPSY
jgi:hypothetical protein